MLAARDLVIVWGDTPQYRKWMNLPDTRFAEVAELKYIRWLEIRGKIDTCMLSPATSYAAYPVYKWSKSGFDHFYPIEVSIGIAGGRKNIEQVCLSPKEQMSPDLLQIKPQLLQILPQMRQHLLQTSASIGRSSRQGRVQGLQRPKRREDGWLEIGLGKYFNRHGEDGELEMSIMEVKAPKTGLTVQIRPKG
ncbi:conserved hypothetical protein [Ricinus communis]|uniref:Uncharacterized protein n=1 Tax=Ricinus communis TaxID=3988 RepID=B9T5X3_RICCO|nr:conserved hypothetical protein [Ricinus communis]